MNLLITNSYYVDKCITITIFMKAITSEALPIIRT